MAQAKKKGKKGTTKPKVAKLKPGDKLHVDPELSTELTHVGPGKLTHVGPGKLTGPGAKKQTTPVTKVDRFIAELRKGPKTMAEIKAAKWNTKDGTFYNLFKQLVKDGKAKKDGNKMVLL